MKTVTIQIGNSDDKLTQREWSEFVIEVNELVDANAANVHFFGAPSGWLVWQNVAWVIQFDDAVVQEAFQKKLIEIRKKYKQDSVAWTEGETLFL
jgi:hypothetical protein